MLSIVVPVYNGRNNLKPLFHHIKSAVESIEIECELIFVDDCSTDGSLDILKQLCKECADTSIKVGWISLAQNTGQQHAVLCGLRHSRGNYVITMDDDLEHPPELISELYQIARGGSDAVYAVADTPGRSGGLLRDLFFRFFLKKPAGLRIGSYRIFSRNAVEKIAAAEQPFIYISAEFFRNGFTAETISYQNRSDRRTGRYSLGSRLGLYMKLILWYTPVISSVSRLTGCGNVQYSIASKGGCL